ncbi:hypothetical protein RvY_10801-2 [Ramazzottius varieornatus]|uniref:Uncharacterized protein n=1 Tax=Ramazzottius varieornatus TaxID=947166 RepID=A0A1D1VDZ5_RAMVA|nr:hypothetical protein RvY_10801-2 [Ramazzottius varieornatus]
MSNERDEDAEALERLAVEELLRDTHKASTRAETFGSTAWQTSNAPKANKIFLSRAVAGTVIQNHLKDAKPASRRTTDPDERRKQSDRNIAPPLLNDDAYSPGSSLSGSTGNKSARETKDAGGPSSDRHASRMSPSGKNHRDRSRRTSPREDSCQRTEQRFRKDNYDKTRRDRSRSK